MSGRACNRGMTLLEVILAVALTVIVVGSAGAFYSNALTVRRSIEEQMQFAEATRLVMDHMTNELRSAMSYPFLNMGMEGRPDTATFICATLPGPSAWAVRKSTEDEIPPTHDLRILTYRLRTHEDEETGEEVIDGLERVTQKVMAAEIIEESDLDSVLLTPLIRFVAFRYHRNGTWLESWTGGDLPAAVEISIGAEPLPEEFEPIDYPYSVFRRVVFVPGSSSSVRGSNVRGLGGSR